MKTRILVMRGGAIGDFILTLPALSALRKRWPDAYIELIGYPHIAKLAAVAGLVDKVTSLDAAEVARYFSLRPAIPDEQKDYVRSFHLIISYLYDPAATVKQNLLDCGARQVIYGHPIVQDEHAVEHLFKPLEELALYPEGEEMPVLSLGSASLEKGKARLGRIGSGVIALHPGSGSSLKNWPLERFVATADQIVRRLSLQPMFVTGEADSEIAARLKEQECNVPVLPECSLVELAENLSACRGYVGNDSGVTHLAASLGIPVVALYGPTDPSVWGARGRNVRIIQGKEMSEAGLAGITAEEVLAALQ